METRLLLRNGEQLVLALVIPVLVLVGGGRGAERLGHRPRRRPPRRRADARRARAGGDVDILHLAGDRDRLRAALRRLQAARRLAPAPVRTAAGQGGLAARRRGGPGRADRCVATVLGLAAGGAGLALAGGAPRRTGYLRRSRRWGCSWPARSAPRRPWRRPTGLPSCCWPAARSCSRCRRTRGRRAGRLRCPPVHSAKGCARPARRPARPGSAVGGARRPGARRDRPDGEDLRVGVIDRRRRREALHCSGSPWASLVANVVHHRHRRGGPPDRVRTRLPDLAAVHRRVVHPARAMSACTRRSSSATGC